jgi:hypothetical protein
MRQTVAQAHQELDEGRYIEAMVNDYLAEEHLPEIPIEELLREVD